MISFEGQLSYEIYYTIILSLMFYNGYIDYKIGLLTDRLSLIMLAVSVIFYLIMEKGVSLLASKVIISFVVYIIFMVLNLALKNSIGRGDIKSFSLLFIIFSPENATFIIGCSNLMAVVFFAVTGYKKSIVLIDEKEGYYLGERKVVRMGPYIFLSGLISLMV